MTDLQTLRKVEDLSDELLQFERRLGEFNIFDLIGTSHLELAHTRMLAFLFDPLAQHRLGNGFANAFLRRLKQENSQKATWLDMDSFEFQASEIERELQRIDLLVIDQTNRLVILVENKVHSSEHSEQLQRYYELTAERFPPPSWRIVPVYLTLEGIHASDERYWTSRYRSVADTIEQVLDEHSLDRMSAVRITLQHYVSVVRRALVGDLDLAAEARRLYNIAPRAFDYIMAHKDYPKPQLQHFVGKLITDAHLFEKEERDFVEPAKDRILVRFSHPAFDVFEDEQRFSRPKKWRWTDSGRMLLLQFSITSIDVELDLVVGPGPEESRQRIINSARRIGTPFNTSFTQTQDGERRWRSIYKRRFLSEDDFIDLNLGRLEELVIENWEDFLREDLSQIIHVFEHGDDVAR